MITVKTFVFNSFQENTYLLFDESKKCVIVDPGMDSSSEEASLQDYILENQLNPVAMINTHCHVDHVLGCKFVKNTYKVPFITHPDEDPVLKNAVRFGEVFGLQVETPPTPDKYLSQGDKYIFGDSELQIMHVPGHSPGSIALYSAPDNFIITGDVLFRGSIGRTDLPGGDYQTLINNIKSKIMVLPREVKAYPGHGPFTTVGDEYDTNPFLV
jgi:glyoxylase-like metal-dependent hydrolase (beta-lactamase superfamily II)